jgi:release factor glutamine methyltransferase
VSEREPEATRGTPSEGMHGRGATEKGAPSLVATSTRVRDVLVEVAHAVGSATEARWIVEGALGARHDAVVLAARGATVPEEAMDAVAEMVRRRRAGEPLQYVVGTWQFRSVELELDRRVLIPRPETEMVAGHAIEELVRLAARLPGPEPLVAVDLGTGSGAIAIALAVEVPMRLGGRQLEVWASDASHGALEVAAANCRRARAAHASMAPVRLAAGSWFDALPAALRGRIALAVANPPYVSEAEWESLDPVVRDHEPRQALVAGPSGTEAIDHLLGEAPRWLVPEGVLVLEVAPHQAEDAALRALVSGFEGVVVRDDLAGRPRTLIARRSLSG